MSMGRRKPTQPKMWVAHSEMPRAPGHRFYDKLNELLCGAEFDRQVEELCAPYFDVDSKPGRRSIAPGVYFRMHLIGYFEGIESERGLEWRCADSLSLREFLGIATTGRVPDHSTLSRLRQRLPLAVHQQAFGLILAIVNQKGLLNGRVLGVDSTYLRADASMKAIVRRDTKESYAEYVKRLAEEAGLGEPTPEDARRWDRQRKGKKTSNEQWVSQTDGDARIAKLKDGRTRLAYKPEHVVDLETGAIVGVQVHGADRADTDTVEASLAVARKNLEEPPTGAVEEGESDGASEPPTDDGPAESKRQATALVADKGYHKAALLRRLKDQGYRTYIPERRQKGYRRWTDKGGAKTAAAFYENRARIHRAKGKRLQRWRGEMRERTFAHVCETGAARRTRLRGRENVEKRYLLQAAAANLGLVMRSLFGLGTPRGWAERLQALLWDIFGRLWRSLALRGSVVAVCSLHASLLAGLRSLAQFGPSLPLATSPLPKTA
jgi:transposase